MDPLSPFKLAITASFLRSINLGAATAAKIPKITMTTTSSIRVKPEVKDRILGCGTVRGFA